MFLWIVLVIRSLLEGLRNEDSIAELNRRLEEMPTDLDEFFQHFLMGVDRFYLEQARWLFQIAMMPRGRPPFSLVTYSLVFESGESGSKPCIPSYRVSDSRTRLGTMKRRLNVRSKGLLEASYHYGSGGETHDPLSHYKVDFLHRSVHDYFQTKGAQNILGMNISVAFNAIWRLSYASIAQLQAIFAETSHQSLQGVVGATGVFIDLFEGPRYIHYALHKSVTMVVEPIYCTLFSNSNEDFVERTVHGLLDNTGSDDFDYKIILLFASGADRLNKSTTGRLAEFNALRASCAFVKLLDHFNILRRKLEHPDKLKKLLRELAEKIPDPNRMCGQYSVWAHFLRFSHRLLRISPFDLSNEKATYISILKLFISCSAETRLPVQVDLYGKSALKAHKILQRVFGGKDARRLMSPLQQSNKSRFSLFFERDVAVS